MFNEKFSEESISGMPKKNVEPMTVFIEKNSKETLAGISIPGIPPTKGKKIDNRER